MKKGNLRTQNSSSISLTEGRRTSQVDKLYIGDIQVYFFPKLKKKKHFRLDTCTIYSLPLIVITWRKMILPWSFQINKRKRNKNLKKLTKASELSAKVAEISLGFLLTLRKFLNISAFDFFLFSFNNLNKFCTFEDHFKMLSYWTHVTCCKMYRLFLHLFVTWLTLEKRNTVGNKLRSVALSLPHLTTKIHWTSHGKLLAVRIFS